MAIVLGVSGKRGTGKSLLCNPYLLGQGFKVYAFADPLKEDVRRVYGLGKEHTDGKLKEQPSHKLGGKTPREAMIAEGQLRRDFSEGGLYWVNKLFEERIKQLPAKTFAVISDVRFKNEAEFIRRYGGYVVRLERDPKLNVYGADIDDPSETDLDSYHFDKVLPRERNVNPQDLEKFAYEVVKWLEELSKV